MPYMCSIPIKQVKRQGQVERNLRSEKKLSKFFAVHG